MKFYFKKLQLYLELAIRSWERHSLRYSYSLFFFFFLKDWTWRTLEFQCCFFQAQAVIF